VLRSRGGALRSKLPKVRRLSTRIAISQLTIVIVVVGLGFWLNSRLADRQLNRQYEYRALAVAQTIAEMPQTIAALAGTGPKAIVQQIAQRVDRSTGAAFVVVVDRAGIRLSSPDPALVGKWFHERVVSLDGRDHLRIDPGKPAPTANARTPVFDHSRRVIGEVSVGFRQREVAAAAGRELPAVALATAIGLPLAVLAALLLARRLKRVTRGLELEEISDLVIQRERLASEQAALRRVATLVALGRPQEVIGAAVAEEVSRLAGADTVLLLRYEPDGATVRLAAWGSHADRLELGARYPAEGHSVSSLVLSTGRPARIDDPTTITGPFAPVARELQARSVIGSPIVVDGALWGAMVASTEGPEPMAADAEQRLASFTELVATAISNAQARADLVASRLRIVSAADEMRRRIERNLHDGAQQRIVTLALELRAIRDTLAHDPALGEQLAGVEEGLSSLLEEVREISAGLHPAILSTAGLGPALRSLARRAALPVTLKAQLPGRLPDSLEVAGYYVVSEALANAAKHAQAGSVEVRAEQQDGSLRIHVSDDGIGGANPAGGSGLVGLRDRVEALGGTMVLSSPPDRGTYISVELPLQRG
jgi:signal transduction histidine kinase